MHYEPTAVSLEHFNSYWKCVSIRCSVVSERTQLFVMFENEYGALVEWYRRGKWVWSVGGMVQTGGNRSSRWKPCQSATLSISHFTGLPWFRTRAQWEVGDWPPEPYRGLLKGQLLCLRTKNDYLPEQREMAIVEKTLKRKGVRNVCILGWGGEGGGEDITLLEGSQIFPARPSDREY